MTFSGVRDFSWYAVSSGVAADLWVECGVSSPLLWASNCERELTATLHSEQYSSFLALSSSLSGLPGAAAAAGAPAAPAAPGASATCSGLLETQPGEVEETGGCTGVERAGVRGHTVVGQRSG